MLGNLPQPSMEWKRIIGFRRVILDHAKPIASKKNPIKTQSQPLLMT